MPARRSGLGRGLGALIPAGPPSGGGALREVPVARIRANQFQPRQHFDEEALSALVDSIRVVGVLQPVLLREVSDGDYELIAGERRWRAARRAGLQSVPALVQPVSDASSLEQALIENLHREDLNALEEAAAYKQLIEEFELTHDEVARRVGRSRAAVTNAIRLIQLPLSVQRLVREREITAAHARALLATPDRELQEQLAQRVVDEGLSVRTLEELVRSAQRSAASFEDGSGQPSAPPGGESGERPVSGKTSALHVPPVGGNGSGPQPRTAAQPVPGGLRPPGVLELEELLADHLNTRVRVEMSARHGRVVVEFANLEDLERIYRLMIG